MSDPMFDYVLARSRARETSILAVATIASSASLVLVSLYFQSGCNPACMPMIQFFGMLFAVAGIVYREVTACTIHSNDENWLNAYIRSWRNNNPQTIGDCVIGTRDLHSGHRTIDDPLCYRTGRTAREVAIRSLLAIPIIVWAFAISNDAGLIASFGMVSYIIALSICKGNSIPTHKLNIAHF